MASPWRTIQSTAEPVDFNKITAEEVMKSVQRRESEEYTKNTDHFNGNKETLLYELDGTDSDAVIAQLLQNQYNKEYDLMLKKTEEKFNGQAKVGISLANYRTCSATDFNDVSKPIDDDNSEIDRFVNVEREYASIPRCGYKKNAQGSEIVTKHDILMSSRLNACRVLEFPPGISTGDTGGFDVKLNNKVFNSLRAHSHSYGARKKSKSHNK